MSHVTVVLGAQWGDEGKGKLVDILSEHSDFCVRFNGGANAGHTLVVNGQKQALHLLPCGILHKQCRVVIGNGVVVHIQTLLDEIESLVGTDPNIMERVFISDRAHIVFDVHKTIDCLHEKEMGKNAIGTTKRGIGPCYAFKCSRFGLRFADLKNFDFFERKMRQLTEFQRNHYQKQDKLSEVTFDSELETYRNYHYKLKDRIVDTVEMLNEAVDRGERVLIEGANAALLDLDLGTYPYVTSSTTSVGGVVAGLGLNHKKITSVIGVCKAYTTRVGGGPFPTELTNEVGRRIQEVGREFGATTSRPRRCGWLDIVALRYSLRINGYDSLNLTKLDVLTGLSEIKIGINYRLRGEVLPNSSFPACLESLVDCEVVYETFKGWSEDISKISEFSDFPENAKIYCRRIEELVGCRISSIGVGPDRQNVVFL